MLCFEKNLLLGGSPKENQRETLSILDGSPKKRRGTESLHDPFLHGSMTPLFWVMTPFVKGQGDSRHSFRVTDARTDEIA